MPNAPGCPCLGAGPPTPLKKSFERGAGAPVATWPDDLWAGSLNPAPPNPGAGEPVRSTARLALRPPHAPPRQSDSEQKRATNSMAEATYLKIVPEQLLGVRGLAMRQVRLLLYSAERSNTRATHIQ